MAQDDKNRITAALENPVFVAYVLTGTFLLIFLLVLLEGPQYSDTFRNPVWAVFLAAICILPPFLPELILFLKKRLTGISYMGLSVSFSDVKMDISCSWDELKLDRVEGDRELSRRKKVSVDGVIERIGILQQRECTQYMLDLNDGHSWSLKLLYFYLIFISSTTGIRQIIFIDTSEKTKQTFIGRVKLETLIKELDRAFPEYHASAAEGIRLGMEIPEGEKYEEALKRCWEQYDGTLSASHQEAGRKAAIKVNAAWVVDLCQDFLITDKVEYRECMAEEDVRAILRCGHRCIAVVDHGEYKFTIDREKFALNFARKMMCAKR